MVKKRGIKWFKEEICSNCMENHKLGDCTGAMLEKCIEAEKLRLFTELREGDCLATYDVSREYAKNFR